MWNIESMFRQRPFSRMSKIDDTSTSPFCKNIMFFLIASYRISLVSLSWKILAFQCQENHLISMQQVPQSILSYVSWSLLQMSQNWIYHSPSAMHFMKFDKKEKSYGAGDPACPLSISTVGHFKSVFVSTFCIQSANLTGGGPLRLVKAGVKK